ncbi:MAG TPA: helix-turn-helix domain-containing protein, partial [Roseiflexaceae bacterium]
PEGKDAMKNGQTFQSEPGQDAGRFVRCSIADAAARLGVSKSTVHKRIKSGALAAERTGRDLVVLLPIEAAAAPGAPASNLAVLVNPYGSAPTPETGPEPAPLLETASSDAGDRAQPGEDMPATSLEIAPDPEEGRAQPDEDAPAPGLDLGAQRGALASAAPAGDPVRDAGVAAGNPLGSRASASDPPAVEASPAAATPAPSVWRRWGTRLAQALIALALGLGILALADYLIDGDSIPLFPEPVAPATPAASPAASPAAGRATAAPRRPAKPAVAVAAAASRPTQTAATAPKATPRPAPTATPAPAARPLSAQELITRAAAAETVLRTGEFEATIDLGAGPRLLSRIRFNLGADGQPPQFDNTASYRNTRGDAIVERITIGDRSWERQAGGAWAPARVQTGLPGELQPLLPHAASVARSEIAVDARAAALRWYDAQRGADVTLRLDPATGVPRQLRRVIRKTGAVLTVRYVGWNTAVEIKPPAGG